MSERLNRCLRSCIRAYGKDIGLKGTIIVVGCLIASAALGDFSGTTLAVCLAAGGVADVTGTLSACLMKCLDDSPPKAA